MNFFKKFGDGGLRQIFWEAAKTGTEEIFKKVLSKSKDKNKAAYDYSAVLEPKTWSFYAMEPSAKVEHVTSNFVESFNKLIDELRYMPLIKLLDHLRGRLMKVIWIRKVTAERWSNPLTPKVCYRIGKLEKNARYALVTQIWQYELEVEIKDTKVGVKLDKRVCDYGYLQLKGIPYVHALACLNTIRNTNKKDHTHAYFHMEA